MTYAIVKFPYPNGCKDCTMLISHDGYSYCPLNDYSGWYGDVPEEKDEHCPICKKANQ